MNVPASGTPQGLETAAPAQTTQAAPARPWPLRPGVWMAFLALLAAVPVARALWPEPERPLPVLWQLPDWHLTDQDGHPFGAAELRGKVYVADFIFTTCTASCPRLTSRMALLQERLYGLRDRVHLVSISIDPVDDTPERLREYAARYRAVPARWTFVTGPEDAVARAVDDGFRVGVDRPPRGPDGRFDPVQLAHSNRFALVDGRGRLRGSYDVDDDGLARLAHDAERLAQEH